MQATHVEPNTVMLTLEGEFDALAVVDARPMLESIIANSGSNVVMDFSAVDFLDSSGIGCLVFVFKRLYAAKRTLTLQGLRDQPLRLIQSLRIDKAIPTRSVGAAA
ncbi:MAG TPA: STAS domain-containing protein [Aliidongia sp.]|nr:STAS domain-containing protein [Aliidongia sp.]